MEIFMIDGTSALQLNTPVAPFLIKDQSCDVIWTAEQHYMIVQKLLKYGCVHSFKRNNGVRIPDGRIKLPSDG